MKVDLCVFLAGNDLDVYTPIFFEMLQRNCDISNLCIHVVEKGTFDAGPPIEDGKYEPDMKDYIPGVGEKVHNYLLKLQKEWGIPFTIYEKHDPTEFFLQATPREPCYHMPSDHANTLHWAMDNCGTNKWIIFCHSDAIICKDIITRLMADMNNETGMYGMFDRCWAVNREAYKKVGVRFNSISAFMAQEFNGDYFKYRIKHINDPQCTDYSKPIFGWDTGELTELIMIAHGWRCVTHDNAELYPYVQHGGSGHGYSNRQDFVDHRISTLLNLLKGLGIQRL